MPCGSDDEEMHRPDSPAPVTPTKSLPNDGAGHDTGNPDAETLGDDGCEEEDPVSPKKRKRVVAECGLVKR
jgi:hypothetical protein